MHHWSLVAFATSFLLLFQTGPLVFLATEAAAAQAQCIVLLDQTRALACKS